jgi:hypothetical protein
MPKHTKKPFGYKPVRDVAKKFKDRVFKDMQIIDNPNNVYKLDPVPYGIGVTITHDMLEDKQYNYIQEKQREYMKMLREAQEQEMLRILQGPLPEKRLTDENMREVMWAAEQYCRDRSDENFGQLLQALDQIPDWAKDYRGSELQA